MESNTVVTVIATVTVLVIWDFAFGSAIASALNPIIEPLSGPTKSILELVVFLITSPFNALIAAIGMIAANIILHNE